MALGLAAIPPEGQRCCLPRSLCVLSPLASGRPLGASFPPRSFLARQSRRRGGGALLGDRIRMNALGGEHVFLRSLATRGARELPERIEAII
ncbi:MAG: hypothetical protein ACRDPD_16285, partial [Streptosporangiaceae bacterium]